jgi:hypothetical protein
MSDSENCEIQHNLLYKLFEKKTIELYETLINLDFLKINEDEINTLKNKIKSNKILLDNFLKFQCNKNNNNAEEKIKKRKEAKAVYSKIYNMEKNIRPKLRYSDKAYKRKRDKYMSQNAILFVKYLFN